MKDYRIAKETLSDGGTKYYVEYFNIDTYKWIDDKARFDCIEWPKAIINAKRETHKPTITALEIIEY